MPANRRESESAPFWFQSLKSPAWRPPTFASKARSYKESLPRRQHMPAGTLAQWLQELAEDFCAEFG